MTVYCLFFSATTNTKRLALAAAQAVNEDFRAIDLTDRQTQLPELARGDFLVVAAPVYGGRIPQPMAQKLAQLQGNGVCAVTLVTYGNRAFEDALLEINTVLNQAHVTVLGSGAFVATHSLATHIAEGRPTDADLEQAAHLARHAARKMADGVRANVRVPGQYPYRNIPETRFAPTVDPNDCDKCGICVRACPTGAIDPSDTSKVDLNLCIDCMRCVHCCPNGLRAMPEAVLKAVAERLAPIATIHRDNSVFV